MTQLVPIRLEDGTEIYMEATEDVVAPVTDDYDDGGEVTRQAKGAATDYATRQVAQSFKAIQSTIQTYTSYTMNAFKDLACANVEEVTLEFGLKVGGEAGVPYVTKGTAESNLKITVRCSFN